MKKIVYLSILLLFVFPSHSSFAQNRLVLHFSDSTRVIENVDTVFYTVDSSSTIPFYKINVKNIDSTVSFPLSVIDSMTYLGPRIQIDGVVHGLTTTTDSLFVMSLTDITPLSDSTFSLTASTLFHNQMIAVTNMDTMPIMLFRGDFNNDQPIVIDSFSTIMALILGHPQLAHHADSNYYYFIQELTQTDSFSVLCHYVGLSISSGRTLTDTLNTPMFIALADVIDQLVSIYSNTNSAKSPFYVGNHTMEVNQQGSLVNMRMWDLNPTYIGYVTDASSNTLVNNLRIPSRADYGVMDIFFNRSFHGENSTFDMNIGGDGAKYFYLSCKTLPAQIDFYLSAFVVPMLSFVGLQSTGCLEELAVSVAQNIITSGIDDALHAGSQTPAQTNYIQQAVNDISDLVQYFAGLHYTPGDEILYPNESFADCIPSVFWGTLKAMLLIYTKVYNVGKTLINTSGRCYYFFWEAPDEMSFCMELYNNSTHKCTTPNLTCFSGNGQQGDPDSLLNEPIVFKINALDEDGERRERSLTLHLRVALGGGTLSDTLFDVTTSPYYDVQKQTTWRLGSDSTQEQRVVAWLTDPTDHDNLVSSPITINAFFHENEPHIDSFKVAADRWVTFSSGNLQYQPSTSTWRFAENQYDMIGNDNANIVDNDNTYTGWIDLFSWATAYNPTFVPNNNTYYDNGASTFYEWGVHPISNGGAQMNMWRTPTMSEWYYLFNHRPNASNLYTYATVCNVHGLILLPDNWIMPDSVSFTAQQHNWTTNVYTQSQWDIMEEAGAIFLPASGFRCRATASAYTATINQLGNAGAYWSSNGHVYYPTYGFTPSQHAYRMDFFGSTGLAPRPMQSVECYYGQSVRLIRNL